MVTIGFIPCRAGSERVKNKNTRPFGGFDGGLLELKLLQFQKVSGLDRIIVSSNDPIVLDYVDQFRRNCDGRFEALPRPDEFGSSATSMESFIRNYIATLSEDGDLFWSHVTHPFVDSSIYQSALELYWEKRREGYDCLVSATKIQKFLWRDGKPFNYDNTKEKWPRSQDLQPVYEINHAIYAIPFETMRRVGDRIGNSPYFFEIEEGSAMDIDWEDQFHLLDEIASARRLQGSDLY